MSNIPRTAVVSGGGTGIGRATAAALVADGYAVVLVGRRRDVLDRTVAELSREDGADVTAVVADLTVPDDVRRCAAEVARRHGTVDALVNNAGSPATGAGGSLEEVVDSWVGAYRANTVSAVLLTEALAPMLPRPGGRIVVVGSRAGLTGGATPAYAAAKGALHTYVLSMAARLGREGITVNAVAPGYTADTELVAGRIGPERHRALVTGIALGRPATAAEVASVIRYLCSPEASYVNGQVIAVDGGTAPVG